MLNESELFVNWTWTSTKRRMCAAFLAQASMSHSKNKQPEGEESNLGSPDSQSGAMPLDHLSLQGWRTPLVVFNTNELNMESRVKRAAHALQRVIYCYAKAGDVEEVARFRNGYARMFTAGDKALGAAVDGAIDGKQAAVLDDLASKSTMALHDVRRLAINRGNMWAVERLAAKAPLQLHSQLLAAAEFGRVRIAKYLESRLPKRQVQARREALIAAVDGGHLPTVKFFAALCPDRKTLGKALHNAKYYSKFLPETTPRRCSNDYRRIVEHLESVGSPQKRSTRSSRKYG